MTLTAEQEAKRQQLLKSSIIGGGIVGLIVAGIAFWIMRDQGMAIRALGSVAAGGLAAAGLGWKNFNSSAREARCEKCGAAFSVSRTDRSETLTDTQEKEERKEKDDGSIEITRWTEEEYDVIETYTCSSCGNVTTKEFTTTKRRNETTQTKAPAGKKGGK